MMKPRFTAIENVLSLMTILRPGEGTFTWLLIVNSFLLLFSHWVLKVIRNVLVMSHGDALDKSFATAISAVVIFCILSAYAVAYRKLQHIPDRSFLTRAVNAFFALSLVFFALFMQHDIIWAYSFYIWQSIYGVLLVSHFWSFCADIMNRKTGQRLFPAIMVGASLGAWLGSLLTDDIVTHMGMLGVMAIALGCLVLATGLTSLANKRIPTLSQVKDDVSKNESRSKLATRATLDGLKFVLRSRYLVYIALFVVLMNWTNTTGEYIFDSFVAVEVDKAIALNPDLNVGELLSAYYSSYGSWFNLCGFLLQTLVVARLFKWLGLKTCVAILPGVMIIGYSLMAFIPIFSVIRFAMIAENSVSYSLANTIRQALYLPLKREEKYVAKTAIESFFWRVGDVIQFVVIYLLAEHGLGWSPVEFIWLCLGLSIVMMLVAIRIGRSYAQTLHKQRDQQHAPVVANPVETYYLHSGWTETVRIPENVFYDPDPGDALSFRLLPNDGDEVINWIKFDRQALELTFSPPENESGQVRLRFIATDTDQLSCETYIDVHWSNWKDLGATPPI